MTDHQLAILNTWFAALALLGSAVGFVYARWARARSSAAEKVAAEARLEADKAAVVAADAQSDSAAALEKTSESNARIATAMESISRSLDPRMRSGDLRQPPAGYERRGGSGPGVWIEEGQAAANRRALNEVIEQLGAEGPVVWRIESREGASGTYRLRNMGGVPATSVRIEGYPGQLADLVRFIDGETSAIRKIRPGGSAAFAIESRLTLTVRKVRVEWNEGDTDQSRVEELSLG